MRVVCYDPSKYPKLKVGNTLVIREVITKMEDGHHIIVMTRTSKVLCSVPIEVNISKYAEGEEFIRKKPAETVKISEAITSPLKKRVSIMGKIVQEDEPKEVKVKGADVKIKTITVEDSSAKSKVTLWRQMADSSVRPGDFIKITDVVTNMYNSTTTLQTTSLSTIEKCDAPVEVKLIDVEAVGVENDIAELYVNTGEMISVSLAMLQTALEVESRRSGVSSSIRPS